jgi:hypothetical protein
VLLCKLLALHCARSQKRLSGRDDGFPSPLTSKRGQAKKERDLVACWCLSGLPTLFEQVLLPSCSDSVLLPLLPPVTPHAGRFHPTGLDKLLKGRIDHIVVQLPAAENQAGRLLERISVGPARRGVQTAVLGHSRRRQIRSDGWELVKLCSMQIIYGAGVTAP